MPNSTQNLLAEMLLRPARVLDRMTFTGAYGMSIAVRQCTMAGRDVVSSIHVSNYYDRNV
jgi:hypothetical protein